VTRLSCHLGGPALGPCALSSADESGAGGEAAAFEEGDVAPAADAVAGADDANPACWWRRRRLLGMQLFGHRHAEIAKRIDIAATAIYHGMTIDGLTDLDLGVCLVFTFCSSSWRRAVQLCYGTVPTSGTNLPPSLIAARRDPVPDLSGSAARQEPRGESSTAPNRSEWSNHREQAIACVLEPSQLYFSSAI
jgi:hypothetical protein